MIAETRTEPDDAAAAVSGGSSSTPLFDRLGVPLTPVAGAYLALLLLLIVSAIASSDFLTSGNLTNVLRQGAPLAVVALGQTVVILVGGIDVSVGAVMSLATVVAARIMNGEPGMVAPTVLVVLVLAAAVGTINGFLIGYFRQDAFVTTLAMMLIIAGAVLVYTQGAPADDLTQGFRRVSEGDTAGLPNGVFVVAVVFLVVWFLLKRTVWGRRVYAVGANPRVALLTGQPVARTVMLSYMLCSMLAGAAGLLLVARLGSGDVNAGDGWELDAIAAVLIGGTVFGGGRGGVAGTIAGVLVLTVLFNLVGLLALPDWVQLIVRGVVIVLGVALYSRRITTART
jgi:ribose transport system permease protein